MVVTLAGNNSFLLRKRLNQVVSNFGAKHGDLAIERLDGEESELAQIMDSIQNLPFLAERKLVIVRDLGANKSVAENIEQIVAAVGDSTELVLVESNPDKRTAYYKALQKLTKLESFEDLDGHNLAKWLVDESSRLGGKLSLGDANYLIEIAGPNQQALSQELAKLVIYDPQISRQTIDLLVEPTPQSKVFDLLDAAFAGQKEKALKLYEDQRAQQVEPQMILAMIAWQLRAITALKLASGDSNVTRELGISPYVVSKSSRLASSMPVETLKNLISGALDIDHKSKTSSLDLDEALKNYLVTI